MFKYLTRKIWKSTTVFSIILWNAVYFGPITFDFKKHAAGGYAMITGRTQLKKMKFFLVSRVRVLLYVIEADEFSYRCLISRNDGPARQSRNESPLFPKNIPSYILAYHSEGKVFSTCGFFHQIEEGLKAAPC